MARDTFFKDCDVLEEITIGNLTILKLLDHDCATPQLAYGTRTTYKAAVNDHFLRQECHVINVDGFDDFYHTRVQREEKGLPVLRRGTYPDDTVCHMFMTCEDMDELTECVKETKAAYENLIQP